MHDRLASVLQHEHAETCPGLPLPIDEDGRAGRGGCVSCAPGQSVHSHNPRQKLLYLLALAMAYDVIYDGWFVCEQVCVLNFVAIIFTQHKIQ